MRNDAAEEGPQRFPWWKDWRSEAVAIVASGPSTTQAEVDLLNGRIRVVAIKENVDLCPWADVAYGCDLAWWQHRRGLPGFAGLKIGWDPWIAASFPDVNTIRIAEQPRQSPRAPRDYRNDLLVDEPGLIGGGGNSGFQALNLAVQFGARRILGIGFDLHLESGQHWYGRNTWADARNPDRHELRRWLAAFDGAAERLSALGVEFLNASPSSALTAYRKVSVRQALEEWRLIN